MESRTVQILKYRDKKSKYRTVNFLVNFSRGGGSTLTRRWLSAYVAQSRALDELGAWDRAVAASWSLIGAWRLLAAILFGFCSSRRALSDRDGVVVVEAREDLPRWRWTPTVAKNFDRRSKTTLVSGWGDSFWVVFVFQLPIQWWWNGVDRRSFL